jgi:hypothetical protein
LQEQEEGYDDKKKELHSWTVKILWRNSWKLLFLYKIWWIDL